jgi:threonylcarbamoyladenosine tRNA methylthiotransferase MtaB
MRLKSLKAVVINLGCKLNQFEGEAIEDSLAREGYKIVHMQEGERPDIVVVNTCTVTNKGDRKSRNTILKAAKSLNHDGLLVVTGCYAETDPEELQALRGVHLVLGQAEKPSVPAIIDSYRRGHPIHRYNAQSPFAFQEPERPHRSRVYIKVQDGCDMYCSYCKVPFARGGSRSRDWREIVASAKGLFQNGYREIILTGINLGSYNFNGTRLSNLLELVLEKTPLQMTIRLSSIEPNHIDEKLLKAIEHDRIAPHFHIPLQSGSDRILKLMHRPYTVRHYMQIIENIWKIRPGCHLASDVMVGFPTEDEHDFEQTVRAIESIQFSSLHVFKYSIRKVTSAALLEDDVPHSKKKERSKKIMTLGKELNYEYRKGFKGVTLNAVFERHGDSYRGITDNYIRVMVNTKKELTRERIPVRVTSVSPEHTSGEVVV